MKSVEKSTVSVYVRLCVATAALCFGALRTGAVTIESNTKLSGDADYRGQGVLTIAADATLDLNGHKLFVDGLAGTGTVTDTTPLGANLIKDGSFEESNITGNGGTWGNYNSGATSADWTSDNQPGHLGFTKAQTTWTPDVKGSIAAFFYEIGNLWQTVTVSEAGDYALTYSYKSRFASNTLFPSHELVVKVDGSTQDGGRTLSAKDWAENTVVLHLAAGPHKIEFVGTKLNAGSTTILDDVSLRKIPTGELHVVATDGQTAEVGPVKLEGVFKLMAEGAGTCLLNADCDWTGLNVSIDTTLDLNGHDLFVDRLVGTGTVTDTTALGANLIKDGSFEESNITGNGGTWGNYNSGATSADWTSDNQPGHLGFTKAQTTWTPDVKGSIAAFFYEIGNLWQTVTVSEAGDYALTYSYKSRFAFDTLFASHELLVKVDGSTWISGRTVSDKDWAENTVVLHLAAGPHKVEFVGTKMNAGSTTILDDVSLRKIPAAGELHVVVPDGQTAEWTSVKLGGALRLVKEGAGTYLAAAKNGSGVKTWYLGGTSVREGCFRVPPLSTTSSTDYSFLLVQQLGAQGSETTVEEGATFDYGGNYDGYCYTIVLNGGTFGYMTGTANPSVDIGKSLAIRLADDSFVDAPDRNIVLGDADLAGHTLTVTSPAKGGFYLSGAMRDGTVVSRVGRFFPNKNADLSDAALVLEGTMSSSLGTLSVRDLEVACAGTGFGHGDNYFTVSGTYTPTSDNIWRFKLLDGATIDLSGRTTALPVPDANGLFFEENATVYVALGERKAKASEPLITWDAKPENVKFRAAPGTVGVFVAKDDGLYRNVGFSIIVR